MARTFNDILKGKFLIDEGAFKNWRMIIFLSILAIIMIASSHSADKKVHRIAALKDQVLEMRSAYLDARLELRKLKMESAVARKMENSGVRPSQAPPQKIKVKGR